MTSIQIAQAVSPLAALSLRWIVHTDTRLAERAVESVLSGDPRALEALETYAVEHATTLL